MMSRAAAMVVVLFVPAVVLGLPPEKGPAHQKAKTIAESAGVKFQQKQYAEAARLFEEAYSQYPSAKLLYNLALVWEEDGKLDRAVSVLERYMLQADAVRMTEVKKWVKTLEHRLKRTHGRVTLNVLPKGTEMAVGVTLLTSPWNGWLPATEHTIRVNRDGYDPLKLTFTVQAGQQSTVSASLKPRGYQKKMVAQPNLRSKPSEQRSNSTLSPWGWTALGTGVAVLATGIGVNIGMGFEAAREADRLDPAIADYQSKFDSKVEDAKRLNSLGYALYGVGGALVVTGATLLVLHAMSDSNAAVSISTVPSSGGGLVAVGGRF